MRSCFVVLLSFNFGTVNWHPWSPFRFHLTSLLITMMFLSVYASVFAVPHQVVYISKHLFVIVLPFFFFFFYCCAIQENACICNAMSCNCALWCTTMQDMHILGSITATFENHLCSRCLHVCKMHFVYYMIHQVCRHIPEFFFTIVSIHFWFFFLHAIVIVKYVFVLCVFITFFVLLMHLHQYLYICYCTKSIK